MDVTEFLVRSPRAGRCVMGRRRACAAMSVLLLACSTPTGEPGDTRIRVTLVSSQTIHVTDGLRIVPETLVIEARNQRGELAPYAPVSRGATTGWLRDLREREWSRAGSFNADSTGRIRFLWQTSGNGPQTLEFSSASEDVADRVRRTFTLLRPAVPLRADSVVPSGVGAVCFQQGGRIGCVGEGRCASCADSASTARAYESVHWFRLRAPPRSLTSTLSGACALLADGNTACWDGLGPDSVAENDIGHPPFVEFRGSIGRTADGAVWKGVLSGPTGYAHVWTNRSWNRIPSDSVLAELLWDYDETFVCARTTSNAVMCTNAARGVLEPSVIMQPFRLLRSATDSAVTRATGGYTSVLYEDPDIYTSVVVRTLDGVGHQC